VISVPRGWGLKFGVLTFLALSVVILPNKALAARVGVVLVPSAEVFEGPGTNFRRIDSIPRGTQLMASNYPVKGFHKVKTKAGLVGWVHADALRLGAVPKIPVMEKELEPATAVKRPHGSFRVRALVTYNLFDAKSLNAMLGFGSLTNAMGYGAEGVYPMADDLSLLFRFEMLTKSLVAVNDITPFDTFQLSYVAFPIQAGLEYALVGSDGFHLSAGALIGFAVGLKFTAGALQQSTPNETIWAASSFTGMAKLNAELQLTKTLTFVAEVGFRYLESGNLTPGVEGNGASRFKVGGEFQPISLSMTGFEFGGGLAMSF
jgi:hypothetical protein